MIPSYHRPTSVEEAVRLKAELGPKSVFLAGGTEVNNRLNGCPAALIDLAALGLEGLDVNAEGLHVGASVTFQQLVEHPETPRPLRAAALQMANRNIRNRATVGGHLGINRSCADLIPALLAAEARVKLVDREVSLEHFIAGEPELVLSVFVPATNRSFGLSNMTRTAADISLIAAAASLTFEGGSCRKPILAVGGVAPHVIRLYEVEKQLDGQPPSASEELEKLIAREVQPIDDQRGSATYKRHLAGVLGAQALTAALGQAESADGGH